MNTGIQTGKSGQGETSGVEPQEGAVNVPQRINDLEKRAGDVRADFQKLERDIEKFKTLAYFVIGAMAVAFTFTSILIGLDYFKNNQDRYEKFIDKTQEIRRDVYTKIEINSILKEFKDCIWFNGLSRCLK